jgi:1-acyl-sn-glycerol-3-phosphate acyltransferase
LWFYRFAKAVVNPIYRLLFRFEVEGLGNIPPEGGVIICGNHFTAHDPIVVALATNRPIAFMAKQELFQVPVLGRIVRWLGAFPVKRGQPDRAALRRSIEVLNSGGCFGIFPEGTRNRSGRLGKGEPGTAYLALKSGAPVIPVGITATYRPFSTVRIKFGPPVDLEPYKHEKLSNETLAAASEAIMAAIGALLEPPVTAVAAGKES